MLEFARVNKSGRRSVRRDVSQASKSNKEEVVLSAKVSQITKSTPKIDYSKVGVRENKEKALAVVRELNLILYPVWPNDEMDQFMKAFCDSQVQMVNSELSYIASQFSVTSEISVNILRRCQDANVLYDVAVRVKRVLRAIKKCMDEAGQWN